MTLSHSHMHTDEIWLELQEYGDVGYEDMPKWLRQELECRDLRFDIRQPTEQEIIETIQDAKDHRLLNNEMTTNDLMEKYHAKL